ncbi:hypothetical protein HNY73_011633, partial [Argiope bruennichi]
MQRVSLIILSIALDEGRSLTSPGEKIFSSKKVGTVVNVPDSSIARFHSLG